MLKAISRFCTRYPWFVIIAVLAITVLMSQQILTKAYFEADVTKFLPKDMASVRSDDYYKKNFNYQEMMLIGIEKNEGSVMEMAVLRKIEQIVLDIKALKVSKTFESKLTGKRETLLQTIGIDTDNITSIANFEDAILDKETGSVMTGSVVKKLKSDFNISSSPGEEELLPESDNDLQKITPHLVNRIIQDRSFRDNLLTQDLHASIIRISMLRKWDYKKRYSILELSTALSPEALKNRFQGKNSTFSFTIYGKTIDGIKIDDRYIKSHAEKTQQRLTVWLNDFFDESKKSNQEIREVLDGEITEEKLLTLMKITEGKELFTSNQLSTWVDFINSLYDFTLDNIDPFSRENLEFKQHNVKDIFDFSEVYPIILNILKKHSIEGLQYYVAGSPVVIGVYSSMMQQDMQLLVPIAVLVVLVILALSFRSIRGVLIPSLTVIIAVLWTLGIMAMLHIPFSISTNVLPVILLAVGTAYGIHFLNRYYEDAKTHTDRSELIQTSVKYVGVAIVMAAITTVSGFSSLATSSLTAIQHFGIFSAVGVFIALLLTLTITPSILVIWPLPKQKPLNKTLNADGKVNIILGKWAKMVIKYPKTILGVFLICFLIAAGLMSKNHIEGSMTTNFKEGNPILLSDRFINKRLTGTTNINLIFKFRDRIHLESPSAQTEFKKRINTFLSSWNQITENSDSMRPLHARGQLIAEKTSRLPGSLDSIVSDIQLIRDILNEEYTVEPEEESTSLQGDLAANSEEEDGLEDSLDGDLEEMEETVSAEDENIFDDLSTEQVLGLKTINKRLGIEDTNWEATGQTVIKLREMKSSTLGIQLQYHLNLLQDFLAVDIKQPIVLHKLEKLYSNLHQMEEPEIYIDEKKYKPTGFVMSPVDLVRKFYKVFYHDDNPEFDRLPNVERDNFKDKTLTDRSIIGVVLNQAIGSSRDTFESMITPDLKNFQVQVTIRDGSHGVITHYDEKIKEQVRRLFPENDPYIEGFKLGGMGPMGVELNEMISQSQVKSIMLSFVFVFIVTFFMFRSAIGGLYSLVPLLFTVILNFGLIALMGGQITMIIMMVASIAIGTGIDYTIHFLERLKIQLSFGNSLTESYIITIQTSGKAILLNATAVALGFLVLVFSRFVPQMMMGVLMFATMVFSSLGALTLLPALILLTRPRFLEKVREEAIAKNSLAN